MRYTVKGCIVAEIGVLHLTNGVLLTTVSTAKSAFKWCFQQTNLNGMGMRPDAKETLVCRLDNREIRIDFKIKL